ncbi:NeuD/PglB/VioB family sugar acetyltransferase [Microbacterium sp. NPDC091676]|uniref:NeuD/PglB/VioB family sugar acetyltransferase n=1 Tax=Microbacterium sp. NPDC091676 TaxID=3364212 RepID=UPI0038259805
MRDLVILGAGGFARETLDVVEAINAVAPTYTVRGFADDAPRDLALQRLSERGHRHLGGIDEVLTAFPDAGVVIAVGAPVQRAALASRVEDDRAVTLVHPGASIGSRTTIAAGSVVCAGALVSTNVRIGRHGHLNPGAIVGHDSVLDDAVSVNPGAVVSGDVHIEAQVLVGANAVVLQGLRIGEGATIGAAACVTKDAPPRVTLVGVPARVHQTTGKSHSS